MSLKSPSTLQKVEIDELSHYNIDFYMKRDDLLHPYVSGNKWRKLKYNLQSCKKQGIGAILTTGGAFSNHLSAVAAACKERGIRATGLVRTHRLDEQNPTLRFCLSRDMNLRQIHRNTSVEEMEAMAREMQAYWLPEGGSNVWGLKGAAEVVEEIYAELTPEYLFVSVGSGGTLAGIAQVLPSTCRLVGISSFVNARITKKLETEYGLKLANYSHIDDYRFGGFGKYRTELIDFAMRFYERCRIPLDPIYTVKTAWAILEMAKKGMIPSGSRVVMLHTGGLQGWKGFRYRFPKMPQLPFDIN